MSLDGRGGIIIVKENSLGCPTWPHSPAASACKTVLLPPVSATDTAELIQKLVRRDQIGGVETLAMIAALAFLLI